MLLEAMLRSPAIHEYTLTKLLASTLDPAKYPDQRSLAEEVEVLVELGIGKVDISVTGQLRFVRPAIFEEEESVAWSRALSAQQQLEEQLTKLLLLSFKRQNLVSWTFEPEVGKEHAFNGQWFSAYGFSWLRPIVTPIPGEKADPCPVVFDVRSTAATVADVEAFVARIRHAGYRPNSKLRILGVMGARFFEPGAHELAKKNGFVLVNFHQEIGNEALEALAVCRA
jgi:hypothetical protein